MKTMLCLVGLILSVALCVSAAAQVNRKLHGRGGEWLSWTSVQRTTYVQGFADGYMMGFYRACDLADQLFETDKPHRLGESTIRLMYLPAVALLTVANFQRRSWKKKGKST